MCAFPTMLCVSLALKKLERGDSRMEAIAMHIGNSGIPESSVKLLHLASFMRTVPSESYEQVDQPLDYKSNGTVTRMSRNRISCSFVVDGYQMTFDATLNPAMAPFTSKSAVMLYSDEDDLTGTYAYRGHIGQNDFEITIESDMKTIAIIRGELNNPLNAKNQVQGSGTWMST
ncbi:hypothetical protein ACEPAH_3162 [Sanghuangporus vaninii]